MDDLAGSIINGLNTDSLENNPNFDFLSKFHTNFHDASNLFFTNDESPYNNLNINCTYKSLQCSFKCNNSNLIILSINIQSISSKFDDFVEFLEVLSRKSINPDLICLQELWHFSPDKDFSLNGYDPLLYKIRNNNTQRGGVGIYIKTGYAYCIDKVSSVFIDHVFESIIVDIIDSKQGRISVGSVYRLGGAPLSHSKPAI